ncbi:hypothetical protein ASZ78_006106 [Callipepla squamata]|uniref:Uncharacterized protein n=1 Tax=Callipepla squamata TaxID=9009 RepID=A0A226MZJ2_CALSU|nr:hypothetical protein ASZ78_006106 [Callipepla squamata]
MQLLTFPDLYFQRRGSASFSVAVFLPLRQVTLTCWPRKGLQRGLQCECFGTCQSDTLSSRLSVRSPCLGPGMLGSLQAPAALQQAPRVLCSVLPPIGKSWAQRGPERKEREREVRFPVLKGWKGTPQEKQHCTVPRMQQHFPPLRSKMQGTEKPQAGKVSCKKTNEEKITCLPPKVEKGRTLLPPLEIEEAL